MTDENDPGAAVNKLFDQMLSAKMLDTPMMQGSHRGRRAALTRAEAAAIKADMRSYTEIAVSYGISKDTIMRVKRTGRYKNIPYIPSDADPSEFGFHTHMSSYPVPQTGARGRPFKDGRAALTDVELSEMGADLRPADVVAARFKVSIDYVRRYRKKHKIAAGRDAIMTEETKVLIAMDPRPDWMIAREYRAPEFIIKRIKERYTDPNNTVTSEGNDGDDDAAGEIEADE